MNEIITCPTHKAMILSNILNKWPQSTADYNNTTNKFIFAGKNVTGLHDQIQTRVLMTMANICPVAASHNDVYEFQGSISRLPLSDLP